MDKVNEQFKFSGISAYPGQGLHRKYHAVGCDSLLPATLFWNLEFSGSKIAWIFGDVTVAAAVLTEFVYEKLMHKKVTIQDMSAAVTGLLLALNLPPSAPWWMGVLGAVFAILIVKQLFGGLGQNFMNPALAARCFLLIFLYRENDLFYIRWCGWGDSSGYDARGWFDCECRYYENVYWADSGNDRGNFRDRNYDRCNYPAFKGNY